MLSMTLLTMMILLCVAAFVGFVLNCIVLGMIVTGYVSEYRFRGIGDVLQLLVCLIVPGLLAGLTYLIVKWDSSFIGYMMIEMEDDDA